MSDREPSLADQIRAILLRDWDPVGIGGNTNLAGEYDEFISPIAKALLSASGENELLGLLREFETYMHAPIEDADRQRAARALADLR